MSIYQALEEQYREEGFFLGGLLEDDETVKTNGRTYAREGVAIHSSSSNLAGTDNLMLSSTSNDLPASAGTRTWAV